MGGAVNGTRSGACRQADLTQAPFMHAVRDQENWPQENRGGPDGTHAIGVGHGS